MSLDISPDGRWIVFDLLGHVYRLAVEGGAGGEAECLTQASGVALNIQPRFSPDGRRIVFVSDRAGHPGTPALPPLGKPGLDRPETAYSFPFIAEGLADVIAAGGGGAIGSHGEMHGLASHWEIWMAASALGPHGALELASLHGARFLGAERDLGTLTVGKLADLLVLEKNPLEDIRNTTSLRWVMKGGTLYEADTLDEVWPAAKVYGSFYWNAK